MRSLTRNHQAELNLKTGNLKYSCWIHRIYVECIHNVLLIVLCVTIPVTQLQVLCCISEPRLKSVFSYLAIMVIKCLHSTEFQHVARLSALHSAKLSLGNTNIEVVWGIFLENLSYVFDKHTLSYNKRAVSNCSGRRVIAGDTSGTRKLFIIYKMELTEWFKQNGSEKNVSMLIMEAGKET